MSGWSSFAILSNLVVCLALTSCGPGDYDVSNETDRMAMKIDIRNALTVNNCTDAIELSKRIYESSYSDNEIRMLYASAHACSIGIRLYDLIDKITTADFSSADQIFKSFVKLFPVRTTLDARFQNGWFAQDALLSMLKRGIVVASGQRIESTYNPGSVLAEHRVDDANVYLAFIAMAQVGTALNRYGYNSGDDPAALGYAQSVALPWATQAAVKADVVGAGCATASAYLNMFDGIDALVSLISSGSARAALSNIVTLLKTGASLAGTNACLLDGFSALQCEGALQRLRSRTSCFERDEIASAAAGIISGINLGWL